MRARGLGGGGIARCRHANSLPIRRDHRVDAGEPILSRLSAGREHNHMMNAATRNDLIGILISLSKA
jgi:hypothetical protein